jgi:LPS-assembly protein
VGLGSEQQATEAKSDILFLTSGRISRELRVDANFQYNQVKSEVDRMNVGVFWTPEPMKVLNVQYRRDTRNLPNILNTNFELIDVSGQWPLGGGWYGVGRLNYLLDEKRVGQSLAGLEYQADCWIFRAVGQRLPTATGVVNTSLFFQIEFNGLSSLGINPMRVLRTNIPGYERLAQPQ